MKYLLLLLVFFCTFRASCQTFSMQGTLKDTQSNKGFWGATLLFRQANETVTGSSTDSAGAFHMDIRPGVYDLYIEAIGYRTKTMKGLVVSANPAVLMLTFPGPCEFVYTAKAPPMCVDGHTDHIIPIVYGLPGKKEMKRSKDGKIYLGGCQVTGCDPKYYCPIHQRQL